MDFFDTKTILREYIKETNLVKDNFFLRGKKFDFDKLKSYLPYEIPIDSISRFPRLDAEIYNWLIDNVKNPWYYVDSRKYYFYYHDGICVFFQKESDAVMFKMVFG